MLRRRLSTSRRVALARAENRLPVAVEAGEKIPYERLAPVRP
ncbi:hypothetical protein ACFO0M_13385 [Micromonospora mangrovi]|uniref:Uncharacterized protein n=2 Tax=Micromonospora TaxID=1873 RepID=A0AAU8HK63_9ACTN